MPFLSAAATSSIVVYPGPDKAIIVMSINLGEIACGTISQQIVTLLPSEAYTTGGLGQTSAANPARIKENNYVISTSLGLLYQNRVAP